MKKIIVGMIFLSVISCKRDDDMGNYSFNNPKIDLKIPTNFPEIQPFIYENMPTKYGVELGRKLFYDKRLSGDNSISCASCHIPEMAFADRNPKAVGVDGRIGLRNAPPIQNMIFLKRYMWDGAVAELKEQPRIPIINPDEMNSSVLSIVEKLKQDKDYINLFKKAYPDGEIKVDRMLSSLAQYMATLISANSKYDNVMRNEGEKFTTEEQKGYEIFQKKCISCHNTELFTDQSFRNIGFPENPDKIEERGRAKVTGLASDRMKFRVPSLRNVEYTAPYGSFGQFSTLRAVLDYLDNGVINSDNLDPILKNNANKIPLTEEEKLNLIAFLKSLSDKDFIKK